MSKFKVGDRVLATDNIKHFNTPMPGTIVRLFRSEPLEGKYDYLVRFDDGAELWSNVTNPIRKKQPVIVITTDGVTTTATKRLGKKVLGTAYSKCAPADTFDYDTGVGLALARLCGFEIKFHEEEPQPPKKYTHKVVCVESTQRWWTVGKVYECKDGVLLDDSGLIRDRSSIVGIYTIEDLNRLWWENKNREARFVALVED